MNCQGNSRRIRILGIPKKGNRIFLEYHDNKIPFIYRVLFASVVRGVEKMSVFPKKSLPAILNFASYIAARRGEVSELVEGARLEIVCRSEAYRRFKSSSLRHINKGLQRFCRNLFLCSFLPFLPTHDFQPYRKYKQYDPPE